MGETKKPTSEIQIYAKAPCGHRFQIPGTVLTEVVAVMCGICPNKTRRWRVRLLDAVKIVRAQWEEF